MAQRRRLIDFILDGIQKLNDYGQGTYDDAAPARLLGVQTDGTVIEFEYNAPPDPVDPVFYKAAGSVLVDGTNEGVAGATVTKNGTGDFSVAFSSPANTATYPVVLGVEGNANRDDIFLDYINRTVNGFDIRMVEQDNGGTAGVFSDNFAGFSFYVPVL